MAQERTLGMSRPQGLFIDLAVGRGEMRISALAPNETFTASQPIRLRTLFAPIRLALRVGKAETLIVRPGQQRGVTLFCWLLKRWFAPQILFGLVAETAEEASRQLLPRRAIDFVIVPNEGHREQLIAKGIFHRRVLADPGPQLSEAALEFMGRRLEAEKRSVLWTDAHLEYKNPSTKHLLYSLPYLQQQGWEIRAQCFVTDLKPDQIEITHVPIGGSISQSTLQLLSYFPLANLTGLIYRVLHCRRPARLSHAMGGMNLWVDLCSIHFVNAVWIPIQWKLGFRSIKELFQAIPPFFGFIFDFCQFHNPRCQLYLPVSDSIGREVKMRCHLGARVEVLPNTYDPERFNPAIRERWRNPIRESLNISPETVLFAFSSQGHYRRKGFWLAAEAISILSQKRPEVKLFVIGGKPETLLQLQGELQQQLPTWREWTIFVGSQPHVERYLAAADAFLFPSYFEAFSLAEIEAAALGLPLFLTPHHGSEMILDQGINGIFLPFVAMEIAKHLEKYLLHPLLCKPTPGKALQIGDYACQLGVFYESLANHG